VTARALAVAAALLASAASPAMAEETALRATRPAGPPVELRAVATGAAWRIRVLDDRRRQVQVIDVESDALSAPPWLGDADGDGAADLWVPVMAGNANTEYEVWRMVPAEGRFSLAGAVSGFGFRRDPAGYLVGIARNGCCALGYEFHRPGADGRLSLAFAIAARFREDGRVDTCEATAEAEKPPEPIRRRWCAAGIDGPRPGQRL
jgi:hypothetical protein